MYASISHILRFKMVVRDHNDDVAPPYKLEISNTQTHMATIIIPINYVVYSRRDNNIKCPQKKFYSLRMFFKNHYTQRRLITKQNKTNKIQHNI